jgi:transcriptional regulator with XRE-family HTH domain
MIFITILLTVKKQSSIFTAMTTQQPTAAPDRFVRLLRLALASQSLSLRKVAEKAGISPAYLSRLVNGERGLPTNDGIIEKLEKVLDFQPGKLFDAAERPDLTAKTFLKKPQARPMMRSLAPLSDADLAKVLKVAEDLAKKHNPH